LSPLISGIGTFDGLTFRAQGRPNLDTNSGANTTSRDTLVFLGGFEFPALNAAATRIKAVARLFEKAGYRVVLIGCVRDSSLGPDDLRPVSMADTAAEAWEIGYPRSSREWLAKIVSIGSLKRHIASRYSDRLAGIVCYNFPALAQLDAARLAWRLGAAAIGDISEWFANRPATSIMSVVKNADTWLRMNHINRRMDGLITSSPYLTRTYGRDVNAILELPTLVSRDPASIDRALHASPNSHPKRLFFAGTGFDPELLKTDTEGLKDRLDWSLELLAEAAHRGANFRFDIYGAEKEKYLLICPQHRTLLEALGDKVTFHGRQPWAVVVEELARADFCFFLRKPTRVTLAGFPTKFSEAVTSDTPVLTNALENLCPYMVEGRNSLSIDVDNREAGVQKLIHALNMPRADVLAMKAYCRANDPFALENFVDGARSLMGRIEEAR
jgi:glycosyltransferase involved in cell wall biosynthesis